MDSLHFRHLARILHRPVQAVAEIHGGAAFPNIRGKVCFWQTHIGVLVLAEILGLPSTNNPCERGVFGFHIHEGGSCTSNGGEFSAVGGHFNPQSCPHPEHAGDLPPLFENGGYAFSGFITDRFSVSDIIGRTVIIHSKPDDFTTQPSGNSGDKIACGEITATPFNI